MLKLSLLNILIFGIILIHNDGVVRASSNDVLRSLPRVLAPKVDRGVRTPMRICQGFEDPSDTDCYMRTDIKIYICTEPITFNPCESRTRISVWHYDHIKHQCYKTSVPVCAGNIIRTMTLIQCLIYCHNKDPYALGKSRSEIFKLNQKKPYLSSNEKKSFSENEKENEQTDKEAIKEVNPSTVKTLTTPVSTTVHHSKNSFIDHQELDLSTKLNGDAELGEFLMTNVKKNQLDDEENDKEVSEEKKKLQKVSQVGGMEMDIIGDSADKKDVDLGFYLWDE